MVTSQQNIHGFDSAGVFFSECWNISVGYYSLRATQTVIHEFTLKLLYCTRVFFRQYHQTIKTRCGLLARRDKIHCGIQHSQKRIQVTENGDVLDAQVSNAYLYLSDA
jgi:hypothetical protein